MGLIFPLTISLMFSSKSWMRAECHAPHRHSGEAMQRKWELFLSGQTPWCFLLLQADQSQVIRAQCTLRSKNSLSPCLLAKKKKKKVFAEWPILFHWFRDLSSFKGYFCVLDFGLLFWKSSERASEIELSECFQLPADIFDSLGVSSFSYSHMHLPKDSLEMCLVLNRRIM